MESKKITTIFTLVGGWIGGYIPLVWGADYFSFSSLVFSALGALLGIWIAFKLTR